MSGRQMHSYEEVKKYLKEYNYILISQEYYRHQDKLDMICDKGHECAISFKNFKNSRRCKLCSDEKRRILQRTPFSKIENFVNSFNTILLTNEKDYKNRNSKLELICPSGHKYISTFHSIKKTNCGCPICRNIKNGNNLREDGDVVVQSFIDKNLNPQFNSEFYINAHQELPYKCKNHIDEGVKYTTYTTLQSSIYICKSCYLENNQRENHWNWQGGISSLSEYLRARLNEWKFNSLKEYDFKCVVSGIHNKELEIHHLYNFNKIVKETVEILNLQIKKINEYTLDELREIENVFNVKHSSYGLGIPLTKEIHALYHMTFGFNNNTKEQFDEFKENYQYVC